MKSYFHLLFLLFFIGSCTSPAQKTAYSIVGSWKLVDMQFDGEGENQDMEEALSRSETRFVYEETGQFTMVLGEEGRGLKGGYIYDPESNILSIIYGAHTDTAIVNWVNINKMIHTTKDGKTRTILERVEE